MKKSRLWSALALVDCPELLKSIHYDCYSIGGANIVTSASYQASIDGLQEAANDYNHSQNHLSQEESLSMAKDYLRSSVRLVREARDEFAKTTINRELLVAASLGSYGAYLANGAEYTGDFGTDVTIEDVMQFHKSKLDVLLLERPDLLAFETIPSIFEIKAICKLLASEYCSQIEKTWISVSCKDASRLNDSSLLQDCIKVIRESLPVQLFAFGINCTSPLYTPDLVATIQRNFNQFGPISYHIIAYPNSGEAWDAVNKCWITGTAVPFKETMIECMNNGAAILGGCCRISLQELRDLHLAVT